jgi:hypothetical protein
MNTRANSFASLADFDVKPRQRKPVDPAQIDQVARATGFPSRPVASASIADASIPEVLPAPAAAPRAEAMVSLSTPVATSPGQRRYTTGRNKQIGLKVTDEAATLMRRLADLHHLPMGEVVYRALLEYERSHPIK